MGQIFGCLSIIFAYFTNVLLYCVGSNYIIIKQVKQKFSNSMKNSITVCNKWSRLIEERTRKVKYLVEHQDLRNDETSPSYTFDYVCYQTEEPIDATCLSSLFPNLMIADFSCGFGKKVEYEDIVTLVKKMQLLKGLMLYYNYKVSVLQDCAQLEMLSTNCIDPCMEKNGVNIKQLHLWSLQLYYFKQDAHYFPNLERLHIYFNESWPDGYYDGPILRKLKILELFLSPYGYEDIYYGFQFMDSCPNLQSALIDLQYNHIFVDESLKHKSLQDLVIEFYHHGYNESFNWKDWKSLFIKYPNLKHLALRSFKNLKNEHVEQLVRILPNLVLFDVRSCSAVTQGAANYVQDWNRLHGRSIKFYFDENYHEIQSDWPQLSSKSEKISQGFDFMKNCFLKDFPSLSTFLISNKD